MLAVLLLGCGGEAGPGPSDTSGAGGSRLATGGAEGDDAAAGSEPSAQAAGAQDDAAALGTGGDGQIARTELLPVLEAGLGRFLQGVETEPLTRDGEFVGFRLVRLWPDDRRFRRAELRPGDVVLRVNGQAIERPGQALQVWKSLRVASELVVDYLRDGERRQLRYSIVDD